ncbi:rod shape-determining protein MreC [Candidatus Falkowbacteria bacterium]|jgi:rod shape-determining protein MreC|nr:rod shape-determining protein MreC [Patescibacteria group bacterium]MDD3434960.1 rod shape-determining protein MreC [Patescibacteria group bacterium]MDD4466615.1 rod shape-determining protein MreC [Patescibacteria group bacterium]NCU43081.1 rod shape-determining protein MreC [Candidatus Falkowbacteria bacterium]
MPRSKNKMRIWWWVGIATLLIFLHFIGWLQPFERVMTWAAKPVAQFFYNSSANVRHFYERREEFRNFSNRVDSLEEAVVRLTVANSDLKELEQENIKLRAQLDFAASTEAPGLLANVISQNLVFDIKQDDQDIVIDRGSNHGVTVGAGVIDENGVIIGKIAEVRPTLARVCLTTSRDCQLPATIQNNTRTIGLTEGDKGLTIKMTYIPQSEIISPGDTVITSGLGGEIPRGLLIGEVSQVNKLNNDIWQNVNIEPLFNRNSLTIVNVLLVV